METASVEANSVSMDGLPKDISTAGIGGLFLVAANSTEELTKSTRPCSNLFLKHCF